MINMVPWIFASLVIVGIAVLVLGILAYKKDWRKQKDADYYTFFVMGLAWIMIGIAANIIYSDFMSFFLALGVIWFVMGIANFQRWRTDKKDARALSGWIRKLPRGSGYLIGVVLGVLIMWNIIIDLPAMIGAAVAVGVGLGIAIEQGIHGKPPKAMGCDKRLVKLMLALVFLGLLALVAFVIFLGM